MKYNITVLRKCIPSPIPDSVVGAAQGWETAEQSKLFVLAGTTTISRALADWVYTERQQLEGITNLDVILDCSGGSIEAAYQLISLFRSKCSRLRAFVPDWAKSSASFFCLGADEIWMSRTAELGPLDAQIPDPRNPDKTISALEEFMSVDYLRQATFEVLDEATKLIVKATNMRIKEALSEASEFATNLMMPLYSQVDPLLFGGAHRALSMSIEYGKRIMSRHAYKDWKGEQIEEVLSKLTWQYPAHSFVIDFDEAKDLNLKVFLLEGAREEKAHLIINTMKECIGFLGAEAAKQKGVT